MNKALHKNKYFGTYKSPSDGRKVTSSNALDHSLGDFCVSKEIWKDIKGYEGKYEVSNLGRVKRLEMINKQHYGGIAIYPEKMMSLQKMRGGYLYVGLRKNNIKKMIVVHRLVARAFVKNPKNKPCINHIDNNRDNNLVGNLEWCTYKENMEHASKQGRTAHNKTNVVLTVKQVKQILKLKGKFLQREIAEKFGVSRGAVKDILNGITWKDI